MGEGMRCGEKQYNKAIRENRPKRVGLSGGGGSELTWRNDDTTIVKKELIRNVRARKSNKKTESMEVDGAHRNLEDRN